MEANVSLLASVGQKREPKLRLAKHCWSEENGLIYTKKITAKHPQLSSYIFNWEILIDEPTQTPKDQWELNKQAVVFWEANAASES